MQNDNRQANKTHDVRSLKIQPRIRLNRFSEKTVPELKLCGNWLQKLGFEPNDSVTITGMRHLLIIRLEEA